MSNVNYCKLFHTGHVLKDTHRYFKFGNILQKNVLNLSVVAMAKPLNLNLTIYQKGPTGNMQIIEHTTDATAKGGSPEVSI